MRCLFFFCRPIRGISPGDARLRRVSLGSHLPLGERLAQQDILQAESVQIFAPRAKFPCVRVLSCAKRTIGFAYPARRSESDSRSEAFSRRRARIFSPKARFPQFDLVIYYFTKRNKSELFRKSKLVRICFFTIIIRINANRTPPREPNGHSRRWFYL